MNDEQKLNIVRKIIRQADFDAQKRDKLFQMGLSRETYNRLISEIEYSDPAYNRLVSRGLISTDLSRYTKLVSESMYKASGLTSNTLSRNQGLTSNTLSRNQGLTSRNQGLTSRNQGLTSRNQGLTSSTLFSNLSKIKTEMVKLADISEQSTTKIVWHYDPDVNRYEYVDWDVDEEGSSYKNGYEEPLIKWVKGWIMEKLGTLRGFEFEVDDQGYLFITYNI